MKDKGIIIFGFFLVIAAFTIAASYPFMSPATPVYVLPYDHYVSFNMMADSLAPNYAYDLATRGESGNNPWVYNIYMFGRDSNGMGGRIAVYGYSSDRWILLSPKSPPLETGRKYHIVWRYNSTHGGELLIDGRSQGHSTDSGYLNTSLSSSFHLGENMLKSPPYPARAHSALNGMIWDGSHYEKDLNLFEDGLNYPKVLTV